MPDADEIARGPLRGAFEAFRANYLPVVEPPGPEATQWRRYSWTGQGFGQSGGPATFPVERTDSYQLEAGDPHLTRTDDGWSGEVTVTVRSDGSLRLDEIGISFQVPKGTTVTPGDASVDCMDPTTDGGCFVRQPAAGVTATYRFTLDVPGDDPPAPDGWSVSGTGIYRDRALPGKSGDAFRLES
ncbi:MAG TPA: hypothetical protein VGN37_06875 [Actinocatenispora sp.]